jgi:7,8-dihydropterin-6-yl-methyl-4-(beta-D-ribofuranosyl)aminobenzene 5'-phosphate synthase
VRILILYDNVAQPPLREGWGFSALTEILDRKILFDVGADRLVLEHNVHALGVDLSKITDVFLSHLHCDHVGGLSYVLEKARGIRVFAPAGMEGYLRPRLKATKAELITVRGPRELGEGLWSTGTMGRRVKEHGLVIATKQGSMLVTGCAHPGVVDMVSKAKEIAGDGIHLVVGGFHMSGMSQTQIQKVIRAFQKLGVERVAPCHCSGDLTRQLFADAQGENFIAAGVGTVVENAE